MLEGFLEEIVTVIVGTGGKIGQASWAEEIANPRDGAWGGMVVLKGTVSGRIWAQESPLKGQEMKLDRGQGFSFGVIDIMDWIIIFIWRRLTCTWQSV